MVYSDWLLIAATIAGPVLAVQAQKWVERARDRANRKRWIIYTLMTTRGARLSQDHVRALNAIDLTYYGLHLFWIKRWQRTKELTVIERWNTYRGHLNTNRPQAPDPQKAWDDTSADLFNNLLDALLMEQHFDFDLVEIKRGNYNPVAHYQVELENAAMRRLALECLLGNRALRVDVAPAPLAPAPPAAVPSGPIGVQAAP